MTLRAADSGDSSARRIFGLETEFGIHFVGQNGVTVSPEEIANHLFHEVVQQWRSSNVFLPNGSRLYIDVGAHPEFATAECDDLSDLIALDKAGELIVQDLVQAAEARLAAAGKSGSIFIYKNNTDSSGNSYGAHENYLLRRRADFKDFATRLLPFLVTRQLVTGAGCITRDGIGGKYSFSPRADHMWEGLSSATTRSRPMINTRDEPHAQADLYRRMHVIVGDSNLAQPTTLLKLGATDLLLRIAERGTPLPKWELENPMQAIRAVAHDLTGQAPVRFHNRASASATEVQRSYLEFVRANLEAADLAEAQTQQILLLWDRALTAVESGDWETISADIDWAIKYRLLQRYRDRLDCTWEDPRLLRLELAFHDINPERSLFHKMEQDGLVNRVVSASQVAYFMDNPPQSTRAKLRGQFVSAALKAGREMTVDWVHLKLPGAEGSTVILKDPFRNEDHRVAVLLEILAEESMP